MATLCHVCKSNSILICHGHVHNLHSKHDLTSLCVDHVPALSAFAGSHTVAIIFLACRILQGEDKLAEIAMPSSWNKLLPNSLLSIRDEKHRQARRTLTPVRFPSPALLYSMSHLTWAFPQGQVLTGHGSN